MQRTVYIAFSGLVMCLLLQLQAAAQRSLVASVAEDEVYVDVPFHLIYELTNVQGEFDLPQAQYIEFLRMENKYREDVITNGKRAVKKVLVFSAVAKKTGSIHIAPAKVKMGSRNYETNSLDIVVKKANPNSTTRARGQGQSQGFQFQIGPNGITINRNPTPKNTPAPEPKKVSPTQNSGNMDDYIFLRTTVDKKNVYKGEQLHAVTKLYYRTNFQFDNPKFPKYPGFWVEDMSPEDPMADRSIETIGGKQYEVITISDKILIPQKDGKLKIPNYQLIGKVDIPSYEVVEYEDPFDDFFSNSPFANSPMMKSMRQMMQEQTRAFRQMQLKTVDVNLSSGDQWITVKPTPLDKNGNIVSVGKYMMQAQLQKNRFSMDEIDTLLVTIHGNGNPSFIYTPKWENKDIEILDIVEQDSITQRNPSIKSYKKIYYLFSALHDGAIDLPPVHFSYFNPETGGIVETVSDSFHIDVSPGKILSKQESIAQNRTRPLHSISSPQHSEYYLTKSTYWIMVGLPFLALAVLGYTQERKKRKPNTEHKTQKAQAEAMRRLDLAHHYLEEQNNIAYYQELSKALWLYISDRSGIELADLNRQSALEYLRNSGVEAQQIRHFGELIDQSERMLYASGDLSLTKKEDYDRALKWISELEQNLQK